MPENKIQPTDASVSAFLASVAPERRRADAAALDTLFQEATGWRPVMWGPSMIGYGAYRYKTRDGVERRYMATGFSPRKTALSVYILPGYTDHGAILGRLGKHKTGRSCVYVNKLADVDLAVLGELVQAGVADLNRRYEVVGS